jgi:hypothetical protein
MLTLLVFRRGRGARQGLGRPTVERSDFVGFNFRQ